MTDNKNNNSNEKNTTGHSWDGISEYNIGAPRWWLIVWIICIIWSVIFWFFYPTWPVKDGNTKGSLGWTTQTDLKESQVEIIAKKQVNIDKIKKLSFTEIKKNPDLLEFALNGGKFYFKENCSACHGTGAEGGIGFPNLNDDDWLWGGKVEDIYQTLVYGIRSGHEKSRFSQMPSFGLDNILNKEQIENVAEYVISLSDKNIVMNLEGQKLFQENCASCHGTNAKGSKEVGAPNLTDKIWLYGGKKEDIIYTINYSRAGVMPYWSSRLDDEIIKQLALYVHSLGGGE